MGENHVITHNTALAILGAGPAGLGAALYAARAGSEFVLLDSALPGGQMNSTFAVDNYLGVPGADGAGLSAKFVEHVKLSCGVVPVQADIRRVEQTSGGYRIDCGETCYTAQAVIAALGCRRRLLGVPGEERLTGRGVSYCAVCDGALYRGKRVAVVGGGDAAVENALYLSQICASVTLLVRSGHLRAVHALAERLQACEKIIVRYHTSIKAIEGDERLHRVLLATPDGEESLALDGLFVAIGSLPNTECLPDSLSRANSGRLSCGEDTATVLPGFFAAGDIREKPLYQIITAVADGAVAAEAAAKFLRENQT